MCREMLPAKFDFFLDEIIRLRNIEVIGRKGRAVIHILFYKVLYSIHNGHDSVQTYGIQIKCDDRMTQKGVQNIRYTKRIQQDEMDMDERRL